MKIRAPLFFLFLAIALGLAMSAAASDGRIEINQASVEAAGGFPYTISIPGSYVLTGPLDVPADTDGVIVASSEVALDLNGFAITGPFECGIGGCILGAADGVATSAMYEFVTVRNGKVSGFSGRCVALYHQARVERLQVSDCGDSGVVVGEQATILANQIRNVGQSGIEMFGPASVFAHNSIINVSLGEGNYPSVQGGTQTAGNYCSDDRCGRVDNRPLFYLTTAYYDGSGADTACDSGFHMASMWELWNLSGLRYDTGRGYTRADSASGPPSGSQGWVRTGFNSDVSSVAGQGNCDAWSSGSSKDWGTHAYLTTNWEGSAVSIVSPWTSVITICLESTQVWCVQD